MPCSSTQAKGGRSRSKLFIGSLGRYVFAGGMKGPSAPQELARSKGRPGISAFKLGFIWGMLIVRALATWCASHMSILRCSRPCPLAALAIFTFGLINPAFADVATWAFNHDGDRIIVSGFRKAEHVLCVADVASGKLEAKLKVGPIKHGGIGRRQRGRPHIVRLNSAEVQDIFLDADGKHVIAASRVGAVRTWNLGSGELVRTVKGPHKTMFLSVIDQQGKHVLSDGHNRELSLWDARTGNVLHTLEGHAGQVRAAAFDSKGERLVTGDSAGNMNIWNVQTGKVLKSWEAEGEPIPNGLGGYTGKIGEYRRTNGGNSRAVTVATGAIMGAAFDRKGGRIVTGGTDGMVRIWSSASGQQLHTLKGHKGRVYMVRFNGSGDRVVSNGWDGTVRLWNAENGELIETLNGMPKNVGKVDFGPGGTIVVSDRRDNVRVWSFDGGVKLVKTMKCQ